MKDEDKYVPNTPSNVYRAPDEDMDADNIDTAEVSGHNSGRRGVRATIKKIVQTPITESDIPIKLELIGEQDLKRRTRGDRNVSGAAVVDPNSYDYDLDEFIEEENRIDEMDRRNEERARYGNADV